MREPVAFSQCAHGAHAKGDRGGDRDFYMKLSYMC